MGISISSRELAKELSARDRQTRRFVTKAGRAGLMRGQALLVKRTPVDLGQTRASWRVRGTAGAGYELHNDAPMAGVLEEGARPHPVNREGREAIKAWVYRVVLGFGRQARHRIGPLTRMQSIEADAIDARANAITQAIVQRLKTRGQPGKFFVRRSLDEIREFVRIEFEHFVADAANKRARDEGDA